MSQDKVYNQQNESFNQKDEIPEENKHCKQEEIACSSMRKRLCRNNNVHYNLNNGNSSSKRASGRKPKRGRLGSASPSHPNKLHHRRCERAGCAGVIPICFASSTERCAGSGYTSRWYHMSSGEHYCNECFEHFYRSYKAGYSTLVAWKKKWSQNAKSEPTFKAFMADQLLPYWVKCVIPGCGKWRQLPKDTVLTTEFIANFHCSMANSKDKRKTTDACAVPEDSRVAEVLQQIWIAYLTQPGLLRDSPSALFLQQYYCDGVGLSPTASCSAKTWDRNPYLQPFYQPTEPGRARCFRPDVMELDEVKEFPEYSREQAMYLGIRNLIIAMWNLNPEEWLTIEKVAEHLICRGLARIRCICEAERILKYFTKKGIINFGIVTSPCGFRLIPTLPDEKVIVIGAGISGVGTARHLQNLGIPVTILEARDRIGGRIWDDNSLGTVVGKGAHIVTGVINNPITVMADQAGIAMRFINDKCDLYDDDGSPTSLSDDQSVEFHFNAMLDAVAEWRKGQNEDVSLYDKMEEMHTFSSETTKKFTKIEENLLQFHISNLEYACGSHLRDVSCLHWDQNDVYPQFAGDHTILPCGYSALLGMAAQQLKISFKEIVKKIDYTGDRVLVTTTDETVHEASRVVVTVPLAILQKGFIEFVPPLPQNKLWALNNLGAGIIEKVVLQFPSRFWDSKLQDADFFGLVPSSAEKRGLFSVFYDLAPQNKNQNGNCHVLMTYVSGDMVSFISEKKERDIVDMCMKVLKSIFSDEETVVPDPTAWIVTKWKDDPFASMVYSYVRIGGNGDAYEFLAEDLEQKIYFAGEATNRSFPQTVTGAYLSGLREASKIIDHISSHSKMGS